MRNAGGSFSEAASLRGSDDFSPSVLKSPCGHCSICWWDPPLSHPTRSPSPKLIHPSEKIESYPRPNIRLRLWISIYLWTQMGWNWFDTLPKLPGWLLCGNRILEFGDCCDRWRQGSEEHLRLLISDPKLTFSSITGFSRKKYTHVGVW